MVKMEIIPFDKRGKDKSHFYTTPENLIYKSAIDWSGQVGRGSLPNMPAGFAIASAICMLGVGIIEAAKVATSTNYI